MSDVMLHSVLCMPPELWRDDPLDVNQRYQRYLQASRRIEDDEREIERMRDELNLWHDFGRAMASSGLNGLTVPVVPNNPA